MAPGTARHPDGSTAAMAFHDTHHRTIRAVLLGLLALQAVAAIMGTSRAAPHLAADPMHYLDVAANLRATHAFSVHLGGRLQPEAWRPLGYPAFLALLETFTGPRPLAIVAVQEALFLLATVLVARFCVRFHPAGETAFLCLVLAYPAMVVTAAGVTAEGPCMLFVILGTGCLLAPRRWRGAIAAGLLFGLTAWFRANLLFLGTAAGLGMTVLGKGRAWKRGLLVAATSLAVMLPNAVRNYRLFGSVSPLPYVSGMGPPLYWNSLHALGVVTDSMSSRPTVASGVAAQMESILKAAHGSSASNLDDLGTLPSVTDQRSADRLLVQYALRNIRGNPAPYIGAVCRNWLELWIPRHDRLRHFRFVYAAVVVCETMVVLLGLWGMLLAVRHPEAHGIPGSVAGAAVAMCLYLPASLCWFWPQNRYVTPVDLLMLGFAALAVSDCITVFARSGARHMSRTLAGVAAGSGTSHRHMLRERRLAIATHRFHVCDQP